MSFTFSPTKVHQSIKSWEYDSERTSIGLPDSVHSVDFFVSVIGKLTSTIKRHRNIYYNFKNYRQYRTNYYCDVLSSNKQQLTNSALRKQHKEAKKDWINNIIHWTCSLIPCRSFFEQCVERKCSWIYFMTNSYITNSKYILDWCNKDNNTIHG